MDGDREVEGRGGLNYTEPVVSAKIITRLATASSSSRYHALRELMHRRKPRTNPVAGKRNVRVRVEKAREGEKRVTRGGRFFPVLPGPNVSAEHSGNSISGGKMK